MTACNTRSRIPMSQRLSPSQACSRATTSARAPATHGQGVLLPGFGRVRLARSARPASNLWRVGAQPGGWMSRPAGTLKQTGSLPDDASTSSSPHSGRVASTSSSTSAIKMTSSLYVSASRYSTRMAGSFPGTCSGSASSVILRSTPGKGAPTHSGYQSKRRLLQNGWRRTVAALPEHSRLCRSGRLNDASTTPDTRLHPTPLCCTSQRRQRAECWVAKRNLEDQ